MDRHPYAAHRDHHVQKERASHIAGQKHRASGGRAHSDEAADRKLIKTMLAEHDREAEGKKSRHRRDRATRAKGGRVGRKGKGATHVNVIVGSPHASAPMPPVAPMPPMPPAAAPAAPPPAIAGLSGMSPMRARGGSVKSGPAWNEGRKAGTKVQHSPAKSVDLKNMNRGKPITYRTGGRVEAPQGVESASDLPGGAGGGAGRRAKIGKYAVGKPMREEDAAR